jgi:hypothetical protein
VKIVEKLHLIWTWTRFRRLRAYELQSFASYWRWRRRRGLLAFQVKKRQFKARSLLRDSTKSISIFGQVMRVIFWRLIFSLVLVFICAMLDQHLANWNPNDNRRRQIIELLRDATEPNWNMRITPRDVMRTRWQQMFRRVLYARGIFQERAFWDYHRSTVKHPSLLVRVFCRSEDLFTDTHDVFLALYIFKRPESAGIKKPHDVDDLERALAPERESEDDQSHE